MGCPVNSLTPHTALDMEKRSSSLGRFGLQRSASMEFKDLTKKGAQISLAMELDKLTMTSPTGAREEVEQNLDGFKRLFGKFITSSGPSVQWDKIEKLPPNAITPYRDLPSPMDKAAVKTMLDQLVVVKLNGGLGTSMGCSGPKSAIPVRNDLTFLDMEIIVNPKQLEGGVNVIQLETAIGAAMKCFDKASGVNVPRSKFLPVKMTSDLLLVMSNLYSLESGALSMSSKRMFSSTPLVKLGGKEFKKVKDFLYRFGSIPDMLELDHLTVSGDVTFGKGVSLRGTVIIISNHGDRIDIPAGAILENKIVSGNLRILDH